MSVNSRLLARTKICVKPKILCFEIAYFSYTNRWAKNMLSKHQNK